TSIITSFDQEFLKEARYRRIKTAAMPRGWDNVNAKLYRHTPDLLIVQNPEMRRQAIQVQNLPAERVRVTGFPQFDWYRRPEILLTREEFCRRTGLDPKRKIIFWGSSGKWTPDDGSVAQTIIAAVRENKLVTPANLIIRPHFSDLAARRFDHLADGRTVFVDKNYTPSDFFRDGWDPSVAETVMFVNTMHHADVVISLCSTLVLDALCFDKPIINTAYRSFYDGQGRDVSSLLYAFDVYAPILTEEAVDLVKSETELVSAINRYLVNPAYRRANRARARDRMCYQVDGQAGQRIAEVISSL
ncbi:MAG TPA: CDP-glycerol glycerophosphotransferase family protein, partial [Candidatus Paceibacterota bacterium]